MNTFLFPNIVMILKSRKLQTGSEVQRILVENNTGTILFLTNMTLGDTC
jgi:hypothetical protein